MTPDNIDADGLARLDALLGKKKPRAPSEHARAGERTIAEEMAAIGVPPVPVEPVFGDARMIPSASLEEARRRRASAAMPRGILDERFESEVRVNDRERNEGRLEMLDAVMASRRKGVRDGAVPGHTANVRRREVTFRIPNLDAELARRGWKIRLSEDEEEESE